MELNVLICFRRLQKHSLPNQVIIRLRKCASEVSAFMSSVLAKNSRSKVPVISYIGLTEAILAFSEKHGHSKFVFVMLVRWVSKISADSFIILCDIPSVPVAFLGFRHSISIFISSFFASGKLYILGLEHFFLIWLIFGWCL